MTTPGNSLAGLGLPSDKLVTPVNAPRGGQVTPGVQPGVSSGVLLAQYVIVFGTTAGVFIYSGTPGPGNPPVYSVSNADSDPYGNTIQPGIWAGKPGGVQTGFQEFGNAGVQFFIVPGGPYAADAELIGIEVSGGAELAMVSAAENSPKNDRVFHAVYSNSASGVGSANWQAGYLDITGAQHQFIAFNFAGVFLAAVTSFTAAQPGTGTGTGNVAVEETWHNVTTDAGWGSLGEPAQYRLLPGANVQLRGDISHAGTTAQTAINSSNPLPTGYRPAATRYYRPPQSADGAGAIQVDSGGVITMRASGFTATQAILDGIYSL